MKNTKTTVVATLILAVGSLNVYAQRDNRSMESGVVTILNNDTADKTHVETTLKQNAPELRSDNGLPRFAIVGKERKFYLGIGAQFLGEGVFTWGDNMASAIDFTPSALTPSTPGNRSNLQFAWQSSSIYLNFVAMPGSENKIGIFFKGKFNDNKTFKAAHFYVKYRGLTAGRANSAFTDGAVSPMTIDGEGPDGYPDLTVFTAYWQQKFSKNFSGAIGIDAPDMSMTTGSTTSDVNQRIPTIPMYLQYAWDGGDSHIRLSGIVRPMQYRNLTENKNSSLVGGGIQLSGISKLSDFLTFSFSGVYGKGIGNYLQDDNEFGLDAVPLAKAGKMETVKSMGLTGAFSLQFSSKVSSNLVYSHLSNWLPENAVVDGNMYRYGDYVVANVIYNFNKFISGGIEYDYGHRKSFDGTGLHANRLQCQLAVTF